MGNGMHDPVYGFSYNGCYFDILRTSHQWSSLKLDYKIKNSDCSHNTLYNFDIIK